MRNKIECLLRLGHDPQQCVSWVTNFDSFNQPKVSYGNLDDFLKLSIEQSNLAVLVPASDIVLHEVDLPFRNRQKLMAAVPFALEDVLASSISEYHFALDSSTVDGEQRHIVATVLRSKINEWIALFKSSNIKPRWLLPEQFCFPKRGSDTANGMSCWIERGTLYARVGDDVNVLETGQDNAAEIIKWGSHEFETVVVYESDYPSIDVSGIDGVSISKLDDDNLLPTFYENISNSKGFINLLQGEFSGFGQWRKILLLWRTPLVLALLLLLSISLSSLFEAYLYESKAMLYKSKTVSLYKNTFPGTAVVQPRLQMQRKLNKMLGDRDEKGAFWSILTEIAEVYSDLGYTGFKLNSIQFNDDKFDLTINSDSIKKIDKFRELLSSGKVDASVSDVSQSGDNVYGNLRVKLK